jgi:hypothetical protein
MEVLNFMSRSFYRGAPLKGSWAGPRVCLNILVTSSGHQPEVANQIMVGGGGGGLTWSCRKDLWKLYNYEKNKNLYLNSNRMIEKM